MTRLGGEPEPPDALDEELEELVEADLIDPLDERLPPPGQPPDPRAAGHDDPDDQQQQDDEEEPRPVFAAVESWVEEIFAKTYIRDLGPDSRWCARWWAHPEAVARLTGLWLTWERAYQRDHADPADDTAMATWIRDYLDRLLPPLMSSRGPFAACRPEQHMDQEPLPTEPAPALPPRGRLWTPPALALDLAKTAASRSGSPG